MCYTLEKVELSHLTDSIGSYAFWRCSLLSSISLPNTITSIGYGAFFHCTNIVSLTLPPIKVLNDYTFYHCGSLATITLPNSIEYIGQNVFNGCHSLQQVSIPPISVISDGLFEQCKSLISIHLPASVTKICYLAFYRCFKLEYLSIYTNVKVIQNMAFTDCTSLHTVEIRDRPTSQFIKLLMKNTNRGPSLQTIMCYSHIFLKSRGTYIVYPRKSSCTLVSKHCWIGKKCSINAPHLMHLVNEFCGPVLSRAQIAHLVLVLNKIL